MKKWTSYIAIALILTALVCVFVRQKESIKDFREIVKGGSITVMLDNSRFGFSTDNDTVMGFQYELVKQFANEHGLELVVETSDDIEKGLEELNKGNVQLLAQWIPVSTENMKRFSLSMAIFSSELMLVQNKNKSCSSQLNLEGDTIFVIENSIFEPRIRHLAEEIASEITIVGLKGKSLDQLIAMVAEGEIKNTVCPKNIADYYSSKYAQLDISLPIGFEQSYAWSVHPEAKVLLDSINRFLDSYVGSPAYWEQFRKYKQLENGN